MIISTLKIYNCGNVYQHVLIMHMAVDLIIKINTIVNIVNNIIYPCNVM